VEKEEERALRYKYFLLSYLDISNWLILILSSFIAKEI